MDYKGPIYTDKKTFIRTRNTEGSHFAKWFILQHNRASLRGHARKKTHTHK